MTTKDCILAAVRPIKAILSGIHKDLLTRGGKPKLPITSLPGLNRILWGLKDGSITIIGARTSQGKSSLALQMAYDLANQNIPVLFLSLEMTAEDLIERLFCQVCQVDNFDLRCGKLAIDPEIQTRWAAFKNIAEKLPLLITCGIGRTFVEINELIAMASPKPKAVFIDYIQNISSRPGETRETINEYIRQFNKLAMQMNFAGVLCSQINRGTEQHTNKEPSLGQLKECVVGKTFISGSKKRIKEIVAKKLNIKIKTLNTNTGKIENIIPVKHIKSGLMNCYQIRTKSGRKVIISDTTKLFNGREWKDLTKLSVGDKIVIEDYAH